MESNKIETIPIDTILEYTDRIGLLQISIRNTIGVDDHNAVTESTEINLLKHIRMV